MAEYLKTLPPNSALRTGYPVADPTRQAGAKLYVDNCMACHQSKGRGIPGVFPPLAGNGVIVAPSPNDIVKVVLGGNSGPQRLHRDAASSPVASDRPADRGHRELRAHELGQHAGPECDGADGEESARHGRQVIRKRRAP